MAEEKTEGKETGKYLTRKYLVSNLQNFWKSIKKYITDQKFADQSYVSGAINNAVDIKVEEALDSLTTVIDNKVDKVAGKGLSENDFTDVLKNKLDQLPDSAATHSNMGFMSGDDKQQLDRLAAAITEVDNELKNNSENPVQNKVIKEELDKKVDKEDLKDPSDLIGNGLSCTGNSDGDIILTLHQSTKHFKIHTESGETIEKFYVSFKDTDGQEVNFNSFGGDNRNITIPNPDGKGNSEESKTYKFYVECYKTLTNGNYEPFILKIRRDSTDPTYPIPSIPKNQ